MEEVCQIAGIELADLARELTAEPTGVTHLSVEQEQEIYRGETFSSTWRRTAGIANAYRQRGTYMSCDYRMTTPYQGTGTCNLSTGAQYQVHIGG